MFLTGLMLAEPWSPTLALAAGPSVPTSGRCDPKATAHFRAGMARLRTESLTGQPPEIVLALLALCVGGLAVILFERFALRTQASVV